MSNAPDAVDGIRPERPEMPSILSASLTVMRSGLHLAQIAQGLRDLESLIVATSPRTVALPERDDSARLQALDLMIQELTGLSSILIGAASCVADGPDAKIDALIDGPRLQSLSYALRGLHHGEAMDQAIVIF